MIEILLALIVILLLVLIIKVVAAVLYLGFILLGIYLLVKILDRIIIGKKDD